MTTGRIDVHSHLLPGVDDGCQDSSESVQCARMLVEAGYAQAFCTPHVWPHLPHNNVREIPRRVAELQQVLDESGVALKLHPGGELNLRPELETIERQDLVTFGMRGEYCLFDLWADELPGFLGRVVQHLHSLGVKTILAHPERMRAVQADPAVIESVQEMGVLLQGNLQCFSDPEQTPTRRVVERYLAEGRYFLLGSDTHKPGSLPCRLDGLRRAIELAGEPRIARLTIQNPQALLGPQSQINSR